MDGTSVCCNVCPLCCIWRTTSECEKAFLKPQLEVLDESRSIQEPHVLVFHSWNGSGFFWIFATSVPCHGMGSNRQRAKNLLVLGDHERVRDECRFISSYTSLTSAKVQCSGKTRQRSNCKLEFEIVEPFATYTRYKLPGRSHTHFRLLAISREYTNFHLILRTLWYSRRGLRRSSSLGNCLHYPRGKQAITGRLDRYDVVILCRYLLDRTTNCWGSCPTTWHPRGRILGWIVFITSNGARRFGCMGEAKV